MIIGYFKLKSWDDHPISHSFKLYRGYTISIVLIISIGILSYLNSFNGPFQADETFFITSNPFITSGAALSALHYDQELEKMVAHRYLGMLTFLLNFNVNESITFGYHLINFLIHICTALLLYCFILQTFRTPFMQAPGIRDNAVPIATFSALLFVSHPVQTEAVTYIFGRLASLAGMFSLLAIVMYTQGRLSYDRKGSRWRMSSILYYLLTIIAVACAMKTKENTFTIPFIIVLYEFLFFNGSIKLRLITMLPLLLTLLIIPLTSFFVLNWSFEEATWGNVAAVRQWSRPEYLFTQFRVIVTYIRLLLVPADQNFDYDYPSYPSFFNAHVLLSLACIILLIGLGCYLAYRSQTSDKRFRLAAFGLFWFFITLSVESSIIPLPFLINEYRLYLPSAGFFIAVVTGTFVVAEYWSGKYSVTVFAILGIIVCLFASATYQRNIVWNDELLFWMDVANKSPAKPRVHINLGAAFQQKGLYADAERAWLTAARLDPGDSLGRMIIFMNLGNLYLSQGRLDDAMRIYIEASRIDSPDTEMLNNLGFAFVSLNRDDLALNVFLKAARRTEDPKSEVADRMVSLLRQQTENK